MKFNFFTKYNKELFFSLNNKMHLSNEIKNDNDVINFYRRARDFSASVNIIFINFAASVKNNFLTLIFFSSSVNNIS